MLPMCVRWPTVNKFDIVDKDPLGKGHSYPVWFWVVACMRERPFLAIEGIHRDVIFQCRRCQRIYEKNIMLRKVHAFFNRTLG